jgi:hypothetical protein
MSGIAQGLNPDINRIYDELYPVNVNESSSDEHEVHLRGLERVFLNLEHRVLGEAPNSKKSRDPEQFYLHTLVAAGWYAENSRAYLQIEAAMLAGFIANRRNDLWFEAQEVVDRALQRVDKTAADLIANNPADVVAQIRNRSGAYVAIAPLMVPVPTPMIDRARSNLPKFMGYLAENSPQCFVDIFIATSTQTTETSPALEVLLNAWYDGSKQMHPFNAMVAATHTAKEIGNRANVPPAIATTLISSAMHVLDARHYVLASSDDPRDRERATNFMNALTKDPAAPVILKSFAAERRPESDFFRPDGTSKVRAAFLARLN